MSETTKQLEIRVEFRQYGSWKVLRFSNWKKAILAQSKLRDVPGVDVISIGAARHPERKRAA